MQRSEKSWASCFRYQVVIEEGDFVIENWSITVKIVITVCLILAAKCKNLMSNWICFRKETKGEVLVEKMDLASLSSIKSCVDRLNKAEKKIDILINNAGVMMCPLSR